MQLNKSQVAAGMREIAALMQFRDENPFKVKAFDNAARALLAEPASLEEMIVPGRLEKVKGIGKATADVIRNLALTGTDPALVELRESAPSDLAGLMRIPNLGVKKIAIVHAELGINTLDELEAACLDGRLANCRGFTAKAVEKIKTGIEQAKRFSGQLLLSQADALAVPILAALRSSELVQRADIAGSLRRRKETLGDLDFVASSDQPGALMQLLCSLPMVASIIGSGDTKSSVLLDGDVQADLRVVPDSQYSSALLHFTGSKEHNTLLRSRAIKQGRKLNEYGLFAADPSGEVLIPASSEDEIYAALGLAWIPPELREGADEIEMAEASRLPQLVTPDDYKGVLHCHSIWSDGKHSIREMALAARDNHGWQYFAICDHSEAAAYAGGIKKAAIPDQQAEVDDINSEIGNSSFHVFKGTECDILGDGSLDYPDDILSTMDVVVASVHSRFQMSAEDMTARIIRAMENPYVHIMGHVSGRLLLSRDPYGLDMEAVLKAAARTRTVMEINADPKRLDLDWRFCRRAKDLGVKFSINPDAHSITGLANVDYGISIARKGGLEPGDIINCLELESFRRWLAETRAFKLSAVTSGY